jgi:replicative DNA helicase
MIELKAPPHSIEAEQAVLSAVFASPDCAQDLSLDSEVFYRKEHRSIWASIQALTLRNQPADVIAVSEHLRDTESLREAGGIEYLGEIVSASASVSNVKHYANIVRERAAERRMITLGQRIADMGYHGEGRTLAERAAEAQGLLAALEEPGNTTGPRQLDEYMKGALLEMDKQHETKGQLVGLSTGYECLDRRTQGLRPDQLAIIAGRPGMGKSCLALNIAEHVVLQGGMAVFFSLEMPGTEVGYRVLSSQSRVPSDRLRTAGLVNDEWDRLTGAAAKMRGRLMFIDDDPGITSAQIGVRTREVMRRTSQKPAVVIVDYLQLLADKGDGVGRVTQISRNLKLAAKSLHCPVIALSQLNRGVENRGDKRPLMGDLRESGAIEADADLIWMIYRDEIYNPDTQQKGITEIITRKARSGQLGTDMLAANLNYYRFDNMQYGGSRGD